MSYSAHLKGSVFLPAAKITSGDLLIGLHRLA